jgi:hypothetical protein
LVFVKCQFDSKRLSITAGVQAKIFLFYFAGQKKMLIDNLSCVSAPPQPTNFIVFVTIIVAI